MQLKPNPGTLKEPSVEEVMTTPSGSHSYWKPREVVINSTRFTEHLWIRHGSWHLQQGNIDRQNCLLQRNLPSNWGARLVATESRFQPFLGWVAKGGAQPSCPRCQAQRSWNHRKAYIYPQVIKSRAREPSNYFSSPQAFSGKLWDFLLLFENFIWNSSSKRILAMNRKRWSLLSYDWFNI